MLTVVGNTSIDIHVHGVSRLPELRGQAQSDVSIVKTDEPVITTLGGQGGITAYVAAALGESVRLWSAVGSDPMGALALDWLEGRHVDTTSVRITGDEGTSTNVLISGDRSGDGRARGVLQYAGASGTFAPRVKAVGGGGTDWLLVAGYAQMPMWRGANTLELLRNARRAGVNTAFDPGDGTEEHAAPEELNELLPYINLLLIDWEELAHVGGRDTAAAAQQALGAGVGAVVVRRAMEGVTIFGKDLGKEGNDVKGSEAPGGDPAAWGGSVNAGLLYARTRGKTLEESVQFGLATAALVSGAKRGVLDAPNEAAVRSALGLGPHPLGQD